MNYVVGSERSTPRGVGGLPLAPRWHLAQALLEKEDRFCRPPLLPSLVTFANPSLLSVLSLQALSSLS